MTTEDISRAKLQSNCHHHETITRLLLQAGCPSCRPSNSFGALKGNQNTCKEVLPKFQNGLAVGRRNCLTECIKTNDVYFEYSFYQA